MTAASVTALRITEPAPELADDETLPASADAEACLIGALLHVDGPRTAAVLARVRDDDCEDPRAQLALSLVRSVVDAGTRADPAAVLATGEQTGRVGTGRPRHRLGLYLADTFTSVPHPGNVDAYAAAVLAQSFRRTMSRFGMRCQKFAEDGSMDDALHVLATGPDALRELYGRMTTPPGKEDRHG